MKYFLGFFLLFVAFGIALKINAWMFERRQPRIHYHSALNKKKSISQPVANLLFFIGIALIYVIAFSSDNTYYNYHLLSLLFMSLNSVMLMVLGFVIFTSEGRRLLSIFGWANWFDKFFRGFLVICCLLAAILGLFGFPSIVIENFNGLTKGPAFSTGVVESKSTSGDSRTGPRVYMTIDGEKYKVPEHIWWRSLTRGEEIRFAHNSIDSKVAFRPEKVSFSVTGIMVSGVGVVLWLATVGIALNGYGTLFKSKPHHYEFPIYNEFYAQSGNAVTVETKAKQKRVSAVWVIVGGLLTILIVAWRRVLRSTKNS
ncbi:MAG: hypothetical protein R3D55_03800 [Chloroflexota bacterium]